VTLTEQGSVTYVNYGDVQQLVRLLLVQQAEKNTALVNSTLQIGQPVVEGAVDLGAVTMQVAAAAVSEYQWSSAQLQAMLNHITGMPLADARAYIQQQPGVDAHLVSISVHTIFGSDSRLPYNASQIKLITVNPSSLPTTSLPVLPTPTFSTESLSSGD
jgi:hypothetical protein